VFSSLLYDLEGFFQVVFITYCETCLDCNLVNLV